MRVLYGGWERKQYRVGDDSSKTFYSVLATWFDDSDTKVGEMSDEDEITNRKANIIDINNNVKPS